MFRHRFRICTCVACNRHAGGQLADRYEIHAGRHELYQLQMSERAAGRQWLNVETFYDMAIMTALRTNRIAVARALLARMPSATDRTPDDLRVLLLDAHVKAAEHRSAPVIVRP